MSNDRVLYNVMVGRTVDKICDIIMFEIEHKKSGRTSQKNNSTSRSKLSKKDVFRPMQKIVLDVLKTDGYHNHSG